jgi:iron complex outermembrane receptor protein
VVSYEAGFRGQLRDRLAGSVSAFYNEYREIRSLAITPTTLFPLVIANDVEGATHGVEVSFNLDVTNALRLHGGYTYLKNDLRVRAGGMDLNNALNETADPENQFAIGASIDLPHGIEFDTHLRWVDTLEVNNEGKVATVPSYAQLTVRVGFHVSDHVELSVVGHNLLDDRHPEFGVPNASRVEIRRSVFAKLAWRF